MKGVILEKPGAPFKVVDGIEKPEPGPGQILVKSIVVAINPVYVLLELLLQETLAAQDKINMVADCSLYVVEIPFSNPWGCWSIVGQWC